MPSTMARDWPRLAAALLLAAAATGCRSDGGTRFRMPWQRSAQAPAMPDDPSPRRRRDASDPFLDSLPAPALGAEADAAGRKARTRAGNAMDDANQDAKAALNGGS